MALLASKRGATCLGQSEPSSASTAATTAAFSSSDSSGAGAATPSSFSTKRAVAASTPLEPVTFSAKASSAAESTTAPPAAPPADGRATATPLSWATTSTAASISLSASGLFCTAAVGSLARSPPRELAPSRVSSSSAASTLATQPSPSCHTLVTRSRMYCCLTPAAPNSERRRSRSASESTAPNGL